MTSKMGSKKSVRQNIQIWEEMRALSMGRKRFYCMYPWPGCTDTNFKHYFDWCFEKDV